MTKIQQYIPPVPGEDLPAAIRWMRQVSGIMNEFMRRVNSGAFFVWDEGCINVQTNTDINGADELIFDSPFTGNGTLVVTGVGFEGGVHVALNGTDLGTLSSANTVDEILYEVQVDNLEDGLNSFKIWSDSSDAGELRRLEAWRNFSRELIDSAGDSAEWGSITGVGKPEDNADVTAPRLSNSVAINAGFELGDLEGWTVIADGSGASFDVTNTDPAFGTQHLEISGGSTTANLGNDAIIPARSGDRVLAQAAAKRVSGTTSEARVLIVWRDSNGTILSTAAGNGVTGSAYDQTRAIAVAPSNTATAEFWLQRRVDSSDTVRFDGATFLHVPRDSDIDLTLAKNAVNEAGADNTTNNPQPWGWVTDDGFMPDDLADVTTEHAAEVIFASSSLPASPESGWLVYLTSADSGFSADTWVRRNDANTAWVKVGAHNALELINGPTEAGANETETRRSLTDWGPTQTFSPTWTGFSSAPSGNLNYAISKDGLTARIWTDADRIGTSNSSAFGITNIPAAIQPAGTGERVTLGNGVAKGSFNELFGFRVWESSNASAGNATFLRLQLTSGEYRLEQNVWDASLDKGIVGGSMIEYPLL